MRWMIAALLAGAVASTTPRLPSESVRGKALYGDRQPQHFSMGVYTRLAARGHASVGIASADTQAPHASGVILAPGLVLTAGHAAMRGARVLPADSLCVVTSLGGAVHPVRRYLLAPNASTLDVALLEVGPTDSGEVLTAQHAPPIAMWRVPLDRPLVLIGHPFGHELRVADGGRVRFPHRPTHDELRRLLVRERAQPTPGRSRAEVRDEILASYRPNAEGVLHSASLRFAGHPTLGMEIDAMQGMSGGGVYDKLTGALVGILFDGQHDVPEPWTLCWGRHEAAVPVVEIVRLLGLRGVDLAARGAALQFTMPTEAATEALPR